MKNNPINMDLSPLSEKELRKLRREIDDLLEEGDSKHEALIDKAVTKDLKKRYDEANDRFDLELKFTVPVDITAELTVFDDDVEIQLSETDIDLYEYVNEKHKEVKKVVAAKRKAMKTIEAEIKKLAKSLKVDEQEIYARLED